MKLRFAACGGGLARPRRLRLVRGRGRVVLRARGHRGGRGGRGAGAGADRPARLLRARRRAGDPALRRRVLRGAPAAADLAAVRAGPLARARGAGVRAVLGGPGRDEDERQRVAATAEGGIWLLRTPRPEPVAALAGTRPSVDTSRRFSGAGAWSDDGLSRTRLAPVLDGDLVRRLDVGQVGYVYRGGVTFLQIKRLTGTAGGDRARCQPPGRPAPAPGEVRAAGGCGTRVRERGGERGGSAWCAAVCARWTDDGRRCHACRRGRAGAGAGFTGRRRWRGVPALPDVSEVLDEAFGGAAWLSMLPAGRGGGKPPSEEEAVAATIPSACSGCRRGPGCRTMTCGRPGGGSQRRRTRTGRTAGTRPGSGPRRPPGSCCGRRSGAARSWLTASAGGGHADGSGTAIGGGRARCGAGGTRRREGGRPSDDRELAVGA